jgi:hypothetical protein
VKTSSHSAVYVYCVFRAARRPRLTGAPHGVPNATVPELQGVGRGTWLVTSAVPLDVYGPANLEPRLRDLDWVGRVAVAHEAVNEFFARASGTVVVPMTLFTMFSSVEKGLDDVRDRRTTIDRVMRRVAGCEEWGIRVTRRPAVAESDETSRPKTGAGFLQARKAERDAAANVRSAAIAAADAAFDRLKRFSKDTRRRSRGPEAGTNPPVLEAAFLVRAAGRAKFKAEARRQAPILAKAGADMALTGPWPAYNFVGREA